MSGIEQPKPEKWYKRRVVTCALGVFVGALAVSLPHSAEWLRHGKGPYTSLKWRAVKSADNSAAWTHFPGDPHALEVFGRPVTRTMHTIGILATDEVAYKQQQAQLGPQAHPAIAYKTGAADEVQMGMLPEGRPFFGSRLGDLQHLAIGMRIARSDLEAAMGYEKDGQFIPAQAGTLQLGIVSDENITTSAPGVPYS